MEKALIRQKILDLYAGKLSAQEQNELQNVLDTLTANELQELFPASEFVEMTVSPVTPQAAEAALSRLKERSKRNHRTISLSPSRWWLAACIAGLVIISGLALYLNRRTHVSATAIAVVYKDIKVANGQRQLVKLEDGTVVQLNGGSMLSVPEHFTGASRQIFLREGEAFFKVARDTTRPFILRSAHLQVQVLGTSFNVRDYSDELHAAVAVKTGKVAVEPVRQAGIRLHLLPGDKALWSSTNASLTRQNIDTASVASWTTGELHFRSATLQEIIQVLQHQYGVQFVIKDQQLLTKKYSATFQEDPIGNIMEQLKIMSGIHYSINNQTVTIW